MSDPYMLSEDIATEMRGRSAEVEIFPLSFAALISARRETRISDCTIVTWDEEGEEDGVRVVPAWKWLL